MHKSVVFAVISEDRPGLVKTLANTVRDHQGNWLESQLTNLGGQFAGVVRVSVPTETEAGLLAALTQLGEQGITVTAKTSSDHSQRTHAGKAEIVGNDRSGIVHEVTRALADHGLNIVRLETSVSSAPMAGTPLFNADVYFDVPEATKRSAVADELDQIADALDVDIVLEWQ